MIPAACTTYVVLWAFRMALDTGGTIISEPYRERAQCEEDADAVANEYLKRPVCLPYVVTERCDDP